MAIKSDLVTRLTALISRAHVGSSASFMPSPIEGADGNDIKDIGNALLGVSRNMTRINATTAPGSLLTLTFTGASGYLITLDKNIQLGLSIASLNPQDGELYIIVVRQDETGSRTLSWKPAYAFPGGSPTAPSSDPWTSSIYGFVYVASSESSGIMYNVFSHINM